MYCLTLKLDTNYNQNKYLSNIFYFKWKIKNNLISWCNHKLKSLQKDTRYKTLLDRYRIETDKKKKKQIGMQLNDLTIKFKLDKSNIYKFVKPFREKYKNFITSQEMDAICDDTINAIEKILYSDGKELHYKNLYSIKTLSAKSLVNGIKINLQKLTIIQGNTKHYVEIPFIVDTLYKQECLLEDAEKIKYCRLKRLQFNNYFHYYIQLVIDSNPPTKQNPKNGTIGIDIGTQTIAIAGDSKCYLKELAPKTEEYNKKIIQIQRKIDRSLKYTNPDNYNENGIIKKGSKFTKSNNCLKLQRQLRTVYRKKSEYTKQSHYNLIAKILNQAKDGVYIEPMDYKSLAKRSKSQTQKSNIVKIINGKQVKICKKKRRFGKSINNKSPGLFISLLKQRCEILKIPYFEIDRTKFKASQYNHITDTYQKKQLSDRWNYKIDGKNDIQRDLYSAFLIKNSNNQLTKPNKQKCSKEFKQFVKIHNIEIDRIKNSNEKKINNSFGI